MSVYKIDENIWKIIVREAFAKEKKSFCQQYLEEYAGVIMLTEPKKTQTLKMKSNRL